MKKLTLLFSVLLTALLAAPASCFADAPQNRNSHRVIPTVTLLVKTFSTLEGEWLDAIKAKDSAAINKIVADNFELRIAAMPGRPIPRDEFIAQLLKEAAFDGSISQMATHEYGDIVEVSFMLQLSTAKNSPLAQQIFVVDTWKKVDANWQVVLRYAAPVSAAAKRVPGADIGEPTIKKKI